MKAVRAFTGIVAPLLRPNIDTDAIIPSREMKRVSKQGLGEGLFAGWRYQAVEARTPKPDFVLNWSAYDGASILAAGPNFGCGSSREHAVWALQEFGIRAVLAPSFGAIFERNAYNNGLLPISLDGPAIKAILAETEPDPAGRLLGIDLERLQLTLPGGITLPFEVPTMQREMLLNGWDPIDRTLQFADAIDDFLAQDRADRPWVYELEPSQAPGGCTESVIQQDADRLPLKGKA